MLLATYACLQCAALTLINICRAFNLRGAKYLGVAHQGVSGVLRFLQWGLQNTYYRNF